MRADSVYGTRDRPDIRRLAGPGNGRRAQAVVVDMSAVGQTSARVQPGNPDAYTGVALVPGTRSDLQTANIPLVVTSAPCLDPALALDLGGPLLPVAGLCSHGGPVMHGNEKFDLTWDPGRRDWATTRNYVEQFLRDVADGSGTFTSPYAETSQYTDATGRAANASRYGGGCIDLGSHGGACAFGNTTGAGAGRDYPDPDPVLGCDVAGMNWFDELLSGAFGAGANVTCLTDSQLQSELATMIRQTGLLGRTEPGYTPLSSC